MDRLTTDQRLNIDDEIVSGNGRVRLIMQGDGNLVLYRTDDGNPLWASGTAGTPASYAIMQGDGNLVVYDSAGTPFWSSATGGNPGAFLVIQDDGNLVVYGVDGAALWASDTVQRFGPVKVPGFLPSTRAPLFHNNPWPSGTSLTVSILGLPPVSLDATTMGLCGGMSFLTRDIFESGTPQLRNKVSSEIPPQLVQQLLSRLIDSFAGPQIVARWLAATAALDHDTVVWGDGLFRRTLREIPAILDSIDNGILCPIGLVLVHSYAPWDVFQNHVVLVWGYETHGDILTLHTYDCNREGKDDIVIQLDISEPAPAKTIATNGTGPVRGFFPISYTHADPAPAYVDDAVVSTPTPPPVPMAAGATAGVRVSAKNTGSTTWTPADSYRLGSQDPQDNASWGANRVQLRQPTVDPGETVAFDFQAQAPGAAGSYRFCWQMVRDGVHWFGNAGPSIPVAVGSTADTCEQLHDNHGFLATQLAEVRAEIAAIDWSDPVIARHEAAALNGRAKALLGQLERIEAQQAANGCAPG
ncbi:hypothetical protein DMA12_46630 [Amycolatopsis balhimycina DSM 5908]|uniref:Bulb-type lectin domain-containing protein n=1 Tax=Amycolatopsis balhimycina DSM 5908 TaxID=1081091 RepID=A0A428VVH2_AMYBA|nr:hypothetical protein [Amycolatopsis balhimycina]RSM34834.1 hypothetical protein DMA12_46630 [Amycolatopsis balhimycina DSM 5908]